MAINLPIISKFDNSGAKQAEGAFSGLGKSLVGLGALIGAAFSVKAISDFAKESVLAAEAIQTSGARIEQIAGSMGLFGDQAGDVSNRLKELASANEQAFAVDENVIMQAQATLLTFKDLAATAGEAGGSFDRATSAAIDLAAAGFGSAETNAIQLGKALNDPIKGITALTRSGVTFTDAEREKIKTLTESGNILEAQNMILSAIETQVGGTAAATADASVKMGLAFGEIKETVGAALLPAFAAFTAAALPLIQDLLPKIAAFMNENVAPALMNAADAFTNLVERFRSGESLGEILSSIFASVQEWFTGGGLEQMFASIMELRQKIVDGILEALPGILEGLVAMIPQVVEFIAGTLIPQILESFASIVTELAAIFSEIMPMFIQAIADVVPDLIQSLVSLLPPMLTTLLGMIPQLIQTGIELFNALVEAVVEITPQLIDTIVKLLPELMDSIVSMLPGILEAAIDLFTAIVEALPIVLPALINAVLDLLPEIINTLVGMLPVLIDAAFKLFTGLVMAFQNVAPNLIWEMLKLIPKIVGTLIGAVPKLVSAGFELVSGFARGIIDNFPKVVGNAISSMGNFVVDTIKNLLGIKSPSRVFMRIGEDVVAGFNKGIADGESLVAKTSMDMAHTVTAASASQFATVAPSVSPSFIGKPVGTSSINITVNAGMGADGTSIGQQIVNEILRYERSSGRVFARA